MRDTKRLPSPNTTAARRAVPAGTGAPDGYWTQRQAAAVLGVSPRYLRASSCPKLLLPGTGTAGRPLVRYAPDAVHAWAASYRSDRRSA